MAIEPQLLERCMKLMDESGPVYLATVNGAAPRLRALWNLRRQDWFPSAAGFCRKQGLVAYFATSASSGKVRDIRANPAVSLYYCDADNVHGVMLAGQAEILLDPGLKRTLWHDSWSIYWATGPDDPDYCVLRVAPSEAVGWWGSSPFYFETKSRMKRRQGGFLIAKIHRTAGRVFARMLHQGGIQINPAQGRILFVLWEEGPMTIHELAKRSGLVKSTLTSTLDRLEAQGQVVRMRSDEDRRKIVIELTPRNHAMHKLYNQVSKEMVSLFYRGFSPSEITAFEASLARILANLEKTEDRD